MGSIRYHNYFFRVLPRLQAQIAILSAKSNLLVHITTLKTLVPSFVSFSGVVLSAGSGAPPAAVPPRYSFDVRELTAHPVQEPPAPVSGACSPSN